MTLTSVHGYHDGTKHHFNSFARSLGYLDWASQPRPFREYAGAPSFALYPAPALPADAYAPGPATYDQLFGPPLPAQPLSAPAIGDVLRHALGLSAWKQFDTSRWSLRVNPSSGNLHPTEAYIVCGSLRGLAETPAVYHYASDRHALEQRCAFDEAAWDAATGGGDVALVALTSVHWREAWKYGERAFRYCQHDLGHAMAAVGLAAALVGWRAVMLPAWSHQSIATLTGVDRDEDFVDAEREEPGCVMALWCDSSRDARSVRLSRLAALGRDSQPAPGLLDAVRAGRWFGRASQLSDDHVEWTFIDEIARETRDPGHASGPPEGGPHVPQGGSHAQQDGLHVQHGGPQAPDRRLDARAIIIQRRSAVAFDGRSSIDRTSFAAMLRRVMPGRCAPWDALWWTPRIHLVLFVHRVEGVPPGLYALVRDPGALDRLRIACGREFLWEPADEELPLMCLARGECRALAKRLSCDQDIAADGFFSLGMIADFDASLAEHGPSFYRNMFWESGVVGQVLYLEAEAAGARATGIGCFYDDPVHDVLGFHDHTFQSLYHFTVGVAIDDRRLTTEPGYPWEPAR